MSSIAKTWGLGLILLALPLVGCSGQSQLVGSDDSGVGTPAAGAAGNQRSLDQLLVDKEASDPDPRPYKCLPLPLADSSCQVLTTRTGSACDCQEAGLVPTSSSATAAVRSYLRRESQCDIEGRPACSSFCACEYPRAIGPSLIECQTQPEPSAETTGWCYVSADAGAQQAELVADCPQSQQQRLRLTGNGSLLASTLDATGARDVYDFLSCADSAGAPAPRELGAVCSIGIVTAVEEIDVADGFPGCNSGICVANHFQGLVSCPYGQVAGAGDCFLPGHDQPISRAVEPQLFERQAAVASICSCQCSGSGPGPYCTCPESMQCEHLVDDLHVGAAPLAGSYCIPKGSEYYADQDTPCVEPNCGAKHPY